MGEQGLCLLVLKPDTYPREVLAVRTLMLVSCLAHTLLIGVRYARCMGKNEWPIGPVRCAAWWSRIGRGRTEPAARETVCREAPEPGARPVLVVGAQGDAHTALAARVEEAGYTGTVAALADALLLIRSLRPPLMLLDAVGLKTAVATVRDLRAAAVAPLAIVVVVPDATLGPPVLDAGADDFLLPSVSSAELRVRLQAHRRWAMAAASRGAPP